MGGWEGGGFDLGGFSDLDVRTLLLRYLSYPFTHPTHRFTHPPPSFHPSIYHLLPSNSLKTLTLAPLLPRSNPAANRSRVTLTARASVSKRENSKRRMSRASVRVISAWARLFFAGGEEVSLCLCLCGCVGKEGVREYMEG